MNGELAQTLLHALVAATTVLTGCEGEPPEPVAEERENPGRWRPWRPDDAGLTEPDFPTDWTETTK